MSLFMTACYYDCNNENVFWVTLGDYNCNGMFLTIHNLNIAGVFDCFPIYGLIMNSKRFSPLSAVLVRVN